MSVGVAELRDRCVDVSTGKEGGGGTSALAGLMGVCGLSAPHGGAGGKSGGGSNVAAAAARAAQRCLDEAESGTFDATLNATGAYRDWVWTGMHDSEDGLMRGPGWVGWGHATGGVNGSRGLGMAEAMRAAGVLVAQAGLATRPTVPLATAGSAPGMEAHRPQWLRGGIMARPGITAPSLATPSDWFVETRGAAGGGAGVDDDALLGGGALGGGRGNAANKPPMDRLELTGLIAAPQTTESLLRGCRGPFPGAIWTGVVCKSLTPFHTCFRRLASGSRATLHNIFEEVTLLLDMALLCPAEGLSWLGEEVNFGINFTKASGGRQGGTEDKGQNRRQQMARYKAMGNGGAGGGGGGDPAMGTATQPQETMVMQRRLLEAIMTSRRIRGAMVWLDQRNGHGVAGARAALVTQAEEEDALSSTSFDGSKKKKNNNPRWYVATTQLALGHMQAIKNPGGVITVPHSSELSMTMAKMSEAMVEVAAGLGHGNLDGRALSLSTWQWAELFVLQAELTKSLLEEDARRVEADVTHRVAAHRQQHRASIRRLSGPKAGLSVYTGSEGGARSRGGKSSEAAEAEGRLALLATYVRELEASGSIKPDDTGIQTLHIPVHCLSDATSRLTRRLLEWSDGRRVGETQAAQTMVRLSHHKLYRTEQELAQIKSVLARTKDRWERSLRSALNTHTMELLYELDAAYRRLEMGANEMDNVREVVRTELEDGWQAELGDLQAKLTSSEARFDKYRHTLQRDMLGELAAIKKDQLIKMVDSGSLPMELKRRAFNVASGSDDVQDLQKENLAMQGEISQMRADLGLAVAAAQAKLQEELNQAREELGATKPLWEEVREKERRVKMLELELTKSQNVLNETRSGAAYLQTQLDMANTTKVQLLAWKVHHSRQLAEMGLGSGGDAMSPTGDDALMGSRGGGSTWGGGGNGAASPTSTRALSRAGGSYQSLAAGGVDSPMGNAARGNTPHHGDDDADHVSKKEKRAVRRAQMAEGRATRLKRDLAKAQNALAREQSYKNEAYTKLNALRDGGVVDDLIRSSVTPRSMTGSANGSLIGPISALRPVQQWQDRYIRASDNCDLAMKDNEELRALLRSVSLERSGGRLLVKRDTRMGALRSFFGQAVCMCAYMPLY